MRIIKYTYNTFILFLLITISSPIISLGQTNSNLFKKAGIIDDSSFIKNFNKFKALVKANDRMGLSIFLDSSYPINVGLDGLKSNTDVVNLKITDRKTFLKIYPQLFDQKMRSLINAQSLKDLNVTYRGIMLKRGQVWWFYDKNTDKIRITSMSNFKAIFD